MKPEEEFEALLKVGAKLMGPEGCPWDREQTVVSIRGAVLEEACEVLDAIDNEDDENLVEELGDLLYMIIFLCMLGEQEKRFTLSETLVAIRKKLIHRHPHVFGEAIALDAKEVLRQWDEIKAKEKSHRESILDGLPKALPALVRAQKMAHKMGKAGYPESDASPKSPFFESEEELGELLFSIVKKAKESDFHPESALRKKLSEHEREFRQWESNASC